MKKGTLLTLLLSLVMGVSSMALVGCGNKDNGDGGDNNNGGSGGNNGGSSVEQPSTPSTPAAPVLLSAATVSNGVKYTYTQTEFKDINGNLATFAELVDTQIDVLAQDVLQRLTLVYGANDANERIAVSDYTLKSVNGNNYVLGENQAKVVAQKLLSNSASSSHSNHNVAWGADLKVDLNCKDCIQSLINYTGTPNFLYYISSIDFTGAIEGSRTTLESYVSNLSKTSVSANAWNWWNEGLANSTYSVYAGAYKNNLKMAIAQILTNSTVNGVYSSDNYNNMLASVAKLGYYGDVKTKLVNFIKDSVIGSTLVQKDDAIYNSDYFTLNNHEVGISFISGAPFENGVFTPEQVANSPRLYKGYSIVVPAIVEQALANTFDGTTKTLYPKMSRTAVNVTTAPAGFTTAEQYETFTVMAKQGAKTTKMVLSFQGNGTTVGKTITVTYQIKAGTSSSTATKQVALNALATDVEFDLNSLLAGKTFGNYSGNTTAYTSNQAGVKADVNAEGQSLEYDNDNYVKFTVSGLNAGEKFVVKLNGIYDKV